MALSRKVNTTAIPVTFGMRRSISAVLGIVSIPFFIDKSQRPGIQRIIAEPDAEGVQDGIAIGVSLNDFGKFPTFEQGAIEHAPPIPF